MYKRQLSDDSTNILFFGGLGIGIWRETGNASWLWLTGATILPMIAVAAIYYFKLVRIGRGDILATAWFQDNEKTVDGSMSFGSRVIRWGTQIFRKDLLVAVVLACALFGLPEVVQLLALLSAWIVLLAQIWRLARRALRKD